MKVEDISNSPELYFSAPEPFLGIKRSSYMYHLSFDLTQQSDDFPRNRTNGAGGDVVIKGKSDSFKLVTVVELQPLVYQKFRSYKVPFVSLFIYVNKLFNFAWVADLFMGIIKGVQA